jgi:hypothetical protein
MTGLLTTADAATLVSVRPRNVRDWASRGVLHAADHTPGGRPLYRPADVVTAERQTRQTTRRRGGTMRKPVDCPCDDFRVGEAMPARTVR